VRSSHSSPAAARQALLAATLARSAPASASASPAAADARQAPAQGGRRGSASGWVNPLQWEPPKTVVEMGGPGTRREDEDADDALYAPFWAKK
jgi:hypothetical protein